MAWFIENWFWLLIFGAFVSMHLFGHGGHGGHRGGARQGAADVKGAPARAASSNSGGHQH